MKKMIIYTFFALLILVVPSQTKAGFDFGRIIDPACFFACKDDKPNVVNTTNTTNTTNTNTNSNNVTYTNPTTVTTPTVVTPVYRYDNNYSYGSYVSDSALGASCYATVTSTSVGNTVIWRASPFGGNYNYFVTFTGSEGLSGSGTSAITQYKYPGVKNASITVVSGNQTITRNCSSIEVVGNYNNNYNHNNYNNYDNYNTGYYNNNYYNTPLTVTCSANMTFAPVGTRVAWQAYSNGGAGVYSYNWYGTDNVSGTGQNLEVIYNAPGSKTAYVTVRSTGGQTITQNCSNTVTVGYQTGVYNPYTVQKQPQTVIKYVQAPTKKVETVAKKVEAPKVETAPLSSLFLIGNVPWGLVAILVIIVLIFTIIYLMFNSKKI